ncbi:MAG: hypothetical protein PHF86_05395 [Candidatus Nanoarchaeia archaeon]|nr:hypothetical protein [Candidatus Nanoarchaeia archaeon]
MRSINKVMIGLAALVLAFTAPNCGGSSGGSGGGSKSRNHAPTVVINQPIDNTNVYRTDSLNYNALCTDSDSDGLTYSWNFGGLSIPDSSSSTGNVVVPASSSLGSYVLTASCKDQHGKMGENDVYVNVLNKAPVGNAGSNISVKCGNLLPYDFRSSYDLDGNLINYNINWGDGNTENDNDGLAFHSYDCSFSGNMLPLKLTVKDNDLSENLDSSIITILP